MLRGNNDSSDDKNKADFFNSLTLADSSIANASSLYLTSDELDRLIKILQSKKNVTVLNLNFNELGDDVIKAIITLVKSNPNIETIRCQYNDITDEGVTKLIQAAENTPRLLEIHIDLASNKITDKSLEHIGKLSPVSILSAVSGNLIKNFQAIENLEKQAKERYASNNKRNSQTFFSEPSKNQPTGEEDKLKAIKMHISELGLSQPSIEKLINYLQEQYKPNTINKTQIKSGVA